MSPPTTGAGRQRPTRVMVAAGMAGLLLLVAGCTGGKESRVSQVDASPLADCAALTAPPGEPAAAPAAQTEPGEALPALTLPCFTGGDPVALPELQGPAVVNLWASWCGPCREELPALQRYADRAAGQVHVVGVVTDDTQLRAAALAEDLDIEFPALDDPDQQLFRAVGALWLPVTIFLDAHGTVQYVHQTRPFDEAGLEALVEEHLQVTVAAGPGDD